MSSVAPVIPSRPTALLEHLGPIPSTVIYVDFETYWADDYTLRKSTTEAYVRDERFQVTGVGVAVGNQAPVWLEEWDFRAWAKRVDWSRVAVCCNNAQFDAAILAWHYGIFPGFLLDTMPLGRVLLGVGGLDDIARKLGIAGKIEGALVATKGKRREDFTQREWLAFGDYCKQDVEITRTALKRLRLPASELWLIDTTIRLFTEPVFVGDQALLVATLEGERTRKRALLERLAAELPPPEQKKRGKPLDPLEVVRATLSSNDKFAELLRSRFGIEPPTKAGTNGPIPAFAKSDPGMKSLLEHENEDVRFLCEARLEVKSTIIETRTERLLGITQRGRVPIFLKYCGAHTHRWSGGDKMNPQNFNRGGALRDALCAPLGESVVVADSGQIEARKVAWFAGERRLVETFRRNDEKTAVYQAHFAAAVRELGRKPTEDEAKGIDRELAEQGIEEGDVYSDEGSAFFGRKLSKKETPSERQIAKALILGLGFNMGWPRCSQELLKGMLGTKPVTFKQADADKLHVDVAGFEAEHGGRVRELVAANGRLDYRTMLIHCAVTAHLVGVYRAKNAQIARSWRTAESMLGVMVAGGSAHWGCLRVIRHGLVKPNGMVLRYPGLRREGDGYVYQGGKSGREVTHVYGGLLVENVVQSLARDVVAEQALWIRGDGYKIATTTHDEIVCVTPTPRADACLETMIARMRVPPAWCSDLPLNAEGGHGQRYGDAK